MRISVLGAGNWGTTLSIICANNRNEVLLWEYDKENYKVIKKYKENKKYLPGIKLPGSITVTSNIAEIAQYSDIILFVVPSKHFRETAELAKAFIKKNSIIASAAKGLEHKTHKRMSEILYEYFPNNKIVSLSGPTIANEIAHKKPAAIVSASKDTRASETVQKILSNEYFRVYRNDDIIGVELGGAIKNVIVLAAGIIDGMGLGDNSKAALITRGLAEITRLGIKMGARRETFSGLSGLGDLFVTSTSKYSRNRHVGEKLGEGMRLKDILSSMFMVAEGVETASAALELSKSLNVNMPITEAVNRILFNESDIKLVISELMNRSLKDEIS
ncbi:MAG: NAD(P)H-dependent glycerol-3-phosphate dehydrogenase [Proteobacteria bacterium]|nr:NAD(P)H-dependent glycerol-3-phosphate dehydrogenase [Pseudomonadota bacterium]